MSNICFYWLGSLVTSLTLKIQLISAVPHLAEQKEQLKSRAEIINQRISSGLFTDIAFINSQLDQLCEDINKLEAINSEAKASKDVI
jgi:outer membrane murein-binding lipoprotein Lpp